MRSFLIHPKNWALFRSRRWSCRCRRALPGSLCPIRQRFRCLLWSCAPRLLNAARPLEESAYLLGATQGEKKVTSRPVTLRTVPSAGARHAFETYLLVNRVEGLTPGLYRYLAIENQIGRLPAPENINELLTEASLQQSQVATSAVTFFWAAVVDRMFWRYVERGYRYLLLDAGHVCENLALAAEQLSCGICPIAAYDDEKANRTLGLDGKSQFVIYVASMGKKIQ